MSSSYSTVFYLSLYHQMLSETFNIVTVQYQKLSIKYFTSIPFFGIHIGLLTKDEDVKMTKNL